MRRQRGGPQCCPRDSGYVLCDDSDRLCTHRRHSLNLFCAPWSCAKDEVRCSSSSSSCFFTWVSCCGSRVSRLTVGAFVSLEILRKGPDFGTDLFLACQTWSQTCSGSLQDAVRTSISCDTKLRSPLSRFRRYLVTGEVDSSIEGRLSRPHHSPGY